MRAWARVRLRPGWRWTWRWLLAITQAADWRIIHPQMQTKINCVPCHAWTPNWCADCHSRRPRDHTADWRKIHGQAVAVHRNCEACHAADFCTRCHGAVPQLNFNPALKLVQ